MSDRKRFFDRERNPFFEHAEAEYFLAWRDGRAVGRITRADRPQLQRVPGQRLGACSASSSARTIPRRPTRCWPPPRSGCAPAAATAWSGPMDFTTNDECGVLIEGYERTPIDPHQLAPPLLPGAARGRRADEGDGPAHVGAARPGPREGPPGDLARSPTRSRRKHGITVPPMRKSDMEAEIDRFLEVYNAAWERNWGFVAADRGGGPPLRQGPQADARRELGVHRREGRRDRRRRADAARLQPGAGHLNGRLLPFGWAKALWYRRRIDRVRVFALGVKREYQHTGVAAALLRAATSTRPSATPQKCGEMGWILETNTAMNRAMEGMGGKIVRTLPRLREAALKMTAVAVTMSPA